MTEKKLTLGQQFLKLLEQSAGSKKKLLGLAAALIKRSHSGRGLKIRKLPDDFTAVRMRAATAKFNAVLGRDVSTDGMLAAVMEAYGGSPEQFKKDFAKNYPKEYYLGDNVHPKMIDPRDGGR